jgi:ribosomal protein S18 acetylase RimI-like enzyme
MSVVVLDQSEPSVAAKIVALQRAAYGVEAQLIKFDGIPPLHETEDDVAKLKITILGAFDETDLIGILGYRCAGGGVDIDRLAVDPGLFRGGIATRLFMEAQRIEPNAQHFGVSTGARNDPAIALYTKLGFRRQPDTVLSTGPVIANFLSSRPSDQ